MIKTMRFTVYVSLIIVASYVVTEIYEFGTKLAIVRSVSSPDLAPLALIRKTLYIKFTVAQPHQSLFKLGVVSLFHLPTVAACGSNECDGTENKASTQCQDDPPGNPCVAWICKYTGNFRKMCTGPYNNTPHCTSCRYDHNVGCVPPPPL